MTKQPELSQLLLDLYEFLDNFADAWYSGGEIASKSAKFQERLTMAMGELEDANDL